ncbi:MAG: UrcA family protein [Sphingopyxis sp.]|uniref:UrcA family protein n=1 Tax=Sphingopyxis sp. TaxID=1908224 RepID=UPI002ABAD979|nr:UrcA family protein [Sphingopyxis sp.]MDZ3831052.1 UrcA family protein [Sphingopyxis sp.]
MAKFSFILAAASLAVAGAAAPALADENVGQSVEVPYGDLNLSTAEGRAQLDQRINRAVRNVCRIEDYRDARQMAEHRECRKVAMRGIETRLAAILGGKGAHLVSRNDGSVAAH